MKKIRDLQCRKGWNREVQELAAVTNPAGGKGYWDSFQVQGTDWRSAGHILFQRRIHVQGFGDRPQFQFFQTGQMFRGCRAEHCRKQSTDDFRTCSGASADTGQSQQPVIGRLGRSVLRFILSGWWNAWQSRWKKKEEKETTLKIIKTWKII